ncbi:M35 family metallo-endopeptidase [Bradyrhizobium canariense]|uniref:M35 family metallo-endopeptidase n=1 Tax=Bradyrhizobium canariense TaxID=255045 RepID=UPI000A18CB31|nr:M35 family metallo-endopeptidase [Bradyrhizobium canariense]OSI22455.1 hypothetical protein BST65_24385 [Bradyrhizobium canariense]OSI28071.1 hypothetical protein BST66_30055 [Bradyrhizobium canariense]OSI46181.1 hypothetical protein BSZ20_11240 [Bradyrhizobium canariense]OSI48500.1 hypothetical protein BSZ15_38390 [Bradyrhizobium canariense]OSI53537.1 hypothetical protein BST67_08955 [Bradyrhizobium canariense]
MTRILLPAILALSCLTATPSHADLEEQKKACSSANKTTLEAAFKAAKAGLVKAIDALKSNAVADQNRYLKWFGTGTPNDVAAVRRIYETALTLTNISTYWCPNNNIPELAWDTEDLAAVHPSAPGAMFFAPAFFNLKTTGADSQQGTIVHELSHRSGATLRPEVYQPAPAKNLANTNPANARKNGDNYQYYYEDLLFTLP